MTILPRVIHPARVFNASHEGYSTDGLCEIAEVNEDLDNITRRIRKRNCIVKFYESYFPAARIFRTGVHGCLMRDVHARTIKEPCHGNFYQAKILDQNL